METKNQVGFVLRKITTEQFAIIESSIDKSNEDFEVSNSARFGVQLEHKVVSSIVKVEFSQNNVPVVILEIACYFEILDENWNNFYDSESQQVKIPKSVASHFVVLAIGTLRGVLHAKMENTLLHGLIMPTVNVTQMVLDDIIINTKE